MTIRKVKHDEWADLQKLNNEVFVDNPSYDPDIIKDWAFSDAGKKYFQELVIDAKSVCFVVENDDGTLVGYIAASPKKFSYRKSKYLEVENMGVIPTYRSQGIGLRLIEECMDWAKKSGYQKLFVNSYFANKKTVSFYEQYGFRPIDLGLEVNV